MTKHDQLVIPFTLGMQMGLKTLQRTKMQDFDHRCLATQVRGKNEEEPELSDEELLGSNSAIRSMTQYDTRVKLSTS